MQLAFVISHKKVALSNLLQDLPFIVKAQNSCYNPYLQLDVTLPAIFQTFFNI